MVISTIPMKYAVPEGRVQLRVFTALATRYTGCAVRGRAVWDGFDTHPASQNSDRSCYSIGKTRNMRFSFKSLFSIHPTSLTLGTILLVVILCLFGTPILDLIELKTYDLRFFSRGQLQPSPAV